MEPLLQMHEVRRTFRLPSGEVHAVRRATLTLGAGEFVAVSGPSGSGKSTVLHMAALLDRPTSGTVLFDEKDVSALDDEGLCTLRKSSVGMVFQRHHLMAHRSVLENVLFRFRYLDFDRALAERLALEALRTVGLERLADRPARLLSGGEMQRVAVARAIAYRPRLLVADEPTGNLDAASGRQVLDCFEALEGSGIAILLVTHDSGSLREDVRRVTCRDGCIEG